MTEQGETAYSSDQFIGKIVAGKYKVVGKIGFGGMSGVYKAEHSLMNRIVALKVLPKQLADDELSRKRFHSEAKIASQLTHPNAVVLYDFGVEDELPYLVMEYIEGKTLKEVMSNRQPMKLERVFRILEQIAGALSDAHERGIIHRDIKPSNIMLRDRGNDIVKVLDFGIAKVIGQQADIKSELTIAGTIIGTPQYMSPEQGLSRELDARSDIYSLGIVMYEMLTGDLPFDAPSTLELLMKHCNVAPTPIRTYKPELNIPESVDRVVMKCLEKEPSNRYQSVEALIHDFRSIVEIPTATSAALVQNVLPISNKKKYLGFGGVSAVTAFVVAFGFLAWRSLHAPTETRIENGSAMTAETRKQREQFEGLVKQLRDPDDITRFKAVEEMLALGTPEALNAIEMYRRAEEERAKSEQEKVELVAKQKQEAAEQEAEATKKLAELQAELQKQAEAARVMNEEREKALKEAEELRSKAEQETNRLKAEAQRYANEREKAEQLAIEQKEAAQKAAEAERQQAKEEAARLKAEAERLAGEMLKAEKLAEEQRIANEKANEAANRQAELTAQKQKLSTQQTNDSQQQAEAAKKAQEIQEELARKAEAAKKADEERARAIREAQAIKEKAQREAEMLRKALEQQRIAAEAARRKAEEERAKQLEEEKEDNSNHEAPVKKRKRCGPNWC